MKWKGGIKNMSGEELSISMDRNFGDDGERSKVGRKESIVGPEFLRV
jgi:hypothetical protein